MNAVLIGCGKVGSELAATLVNEGHDVCVIDNSQKALDAVTEENDLLAFWGSGTDIDLLREANVEEADIFIAVSPSDEINLLSCLMAKQISPGIRTIARIRNPIYCKDIPFLFDRFGLSRIINPEQQTARELYKLLKYPALSRIDFFEDGRVVLCMLPVEKGCALAGKSLMQIGAERGNTVLATAVNRGADIIIPKGDFVIQEADEVSLIGALPDMEEFLAAYGIDNKPAEDVLILGASVIAYYLADTLLAEGKTVRVIDLHRETCEQFSERFPKAQIVMGDGTNVRFLRKQGLANADAFIALTGTDEENIIVANYAKRVSDAKVIAKVNRGDLAAIARTLDIDTVVSPKAVCADTIAGYVRGLKRHDSGSLEALCRYMDNRLEILEFHTDVQDERMMNIPLMQLRLKKNILVACIIRGKSFLIPSGKDSILQGDSVIIVTAHKNITALKDILA